jgi:hypothetical protein
MTNPRLALVRFVALLLLAAGSASAADRVTLTPRLHPGQSFTYRIAYRVNRQLTTQSNVAAPMAPESGRLDVLATLHVQVEHVDQAKQFRSARLRVSIVVEHAPSATQPTPSPSQSASSAKPAPSIDFTLDSGGRAVDIQGLDQFSPDAQAVWREWLAKFAAALAIPAGKHKPGDKWKSQEAIPDSVLARLSWEKETQYVKNEPCPSELAPQRETCAVLLTHATLKQNSSTKDASPEDFKLRQLKSTGTANGANQVITYISLQSGLVLRATEEARQSLDATVAQADGSNRVHYHMEASSHSQILFVPPAAAPHP